MGEFKAPNFRLLSERSFWAVVTLLLCLLAVRQVASVLQESQTIDEGAHLVAGYSYWKTRDFRLLPSHPPLAELFCALPLLVLRPDFSPPAEAWKNADEYAVARHFLYQNRVHADTLLFAGRAMTILVTLALGLTLAWWTRKRFGAPAALFSLLVFSVDPTIIAHGRYITTDLMVTAFLFWSCLSWLAYLESGSSRKLLQTGLLAGLTIASKFNGLILFPIFLLLFLLHRRATPAGLRHRQPLPSLFFSLVLVPFLTVYSLFFFDTKSVVQDPRLGPRVERAAAGPMHSLAHIPVPAYYYFRGLHMLLRDLHGGHHSYLLGKNRRRGSWLYFPVAFAVKTPLATLLLLLLCAALAILKFRRQSSFSFVWLALGLPPLFYFLVSMTSSLNIGVRHILPIYPFLFVLIGAILFGRNHERYTGFAQASGLILGAILVIASFRIHPHYLAFFNPLAGGPRNGPHYLIDSNLDWGQDLKKLKRWTDRNAAAPLCLSYFGQADPEYYGISYRPLSSVRNSREVASLNCVVAVSSHYLFGTEFERFRALHDLEPQARIGYSIYIYDLRKSTGETRSSTKSLERVVSGQGLFDK